MKYQPTATIFYGVLLGHGAGMKSPVWNNRKGNVLPISVRHKETWGGLQRFQQGQMQEQCPICIVRGGAQGQQTSYSIAQKDSVRKFYMEDGPHTLEPGRLSPIQPRLWIRDLEKWCGYMGVSWSRIQTANPDGPRWMITLAY